MPNYVLNMGLSTGIFGGAHYMGYPKAVHRNLPRGGQIWGMKKEGWRKLMSLKKNLINVRGARMTQGGGGGLGLPPLKYSPAYVWYHIQGPYKVR